MAQFKYQIHHIEAQPDIDFDAQLQKVLDEYGMDGWELVQIMHRDKGSADRVYRLLLKTEKSKVGW